MRERGYTHEDYRRAKVIQLRNKKGEEQYFYRSREITKKEADEIVIWEKRSQTK